MTDPNKHYTLTSRGQSPDAQSPIVAATSLDHAVGLFAAELGQPLQGEWDIICVTDSELFEIDFEVIPMENFEPGHA